jgi:muramoyltetrapeptide carboxypeptidase LdcA involved in peptidoglycan recycling
MGSKPLIRPAKLGPGSRVALVAPAGPLLENDDLIRAQALCSALGYEPVLGKNAHNATATWRAPIMTAWPT